VPEIADEVTHFYSFDFLCAEDNSVILPKRQLCGFVKVGTVAARQSPPHDGQENGKGHDSHDRAQGIDVHVLLRLFAMNAHALQVGNHRVHFGLALDVF
jgi:hypothetical protein